MPDEPITPAPVVTPEIVTPPAEVTLDLGDGNLLNKAQALEMKTAKEGLQTSLGTAKQTIVDQQTKIDRLTTDYGSGVQAKAQAELARDASDARVKELEGRTEGYVSKETYATLQEKHDLLVLKNAADRTASLATTYGLDASAFVGKTIEQLNTMEETLKLSGGGKQKPPQLPAGGGAPQSGVAQTAHQGNIDAIAAARAAQKK